MYYSDAKKYYHRDATNVTIEMLKNIATASLTNITMVMPANITIATLTNITILTNKFLVPYYSEIDIVIA